MLLPIVSPNIIGSIHAIGALSGDLLVLDSAEASLAWNRYVYPHPADANPAGGPYADVPGGFLYLPASSAGILLITPDLAAANQLPTPGSMTAVSNVSYIPFATLLIAANAGETKYNLSTDAGLTWTEYTLADNNRPRGFVQAGSGRIGACLVNPVDDYARYGHSTNGISWSYVDLASTVAVRFDNTSPPIYDSVTNRVYMSANNNTNNWPQVWRCSPTGTSIVTQTITTQPASPPKICSNGSGVIIVATRLSSGGNLIAGPIGDTYTVDTAITQVCGITWDTSKFILVYIKSGNVLCSTTVDGYTWSSPALIGPAAVSGESFEPLYVVYKPT